MQTQPAPQQLQPDMTGENWSKRTADSVMKRHPLLTNKWHYEPGVILSALQQVWLQTHEDRTFEYIRRNMDEFILPDGRIRTYQLEEYNLDQINQGKLLFWLYRTTGNEAYKKAAYLLRKQLATHPRTREGGFWHKLIYPHQLWLDGVYMAGPFCAEFARTFDEPELFDDVVGEILLVEAHARDPKTGLLYHAWDESRNQIWADPETGCSPNFWGRAVGWYLMALVDVLDFLPETHPRRKNVISALQRTVEAMVKVQDPETGLWYQVLDQGHRAGNYREASVSCMTVYAIAKAVRQGHIATDTLAAARRGYQGILDRFVEVDNHGLVFLHWVCSVAGLSRDRDGSFEYYLSEKITTNDYKGVGPFIMASVEMETC